MTFDDVLTKEVYKTPECFKHLKGVDYRYVDIYRDGGIIARIALGIMYKQCILHGVAEKWSRGSLKTFKTAFFSTIIEGLRQLGVNEIIVVHKGNEKWAKFIKMLHFSEPELLLVARMEI